MKVNYNKDYFKTWSANMAYILGFYTGDGCITEKWKNKDGTKGYVLSFSLNQKDINILEFIRSEICPNANIKLVKQKQVSGHISDMCRISINNQTICNDILNIGFKLRKTYNAFLPNIPEEYKPDFLRGYFDADGSVEKKRKRARIACYSKDFLIELRNYTVNTGNIIKGHGTWDWCFNTKESFEYFKNYIYNGNFCLKRKFNIFSQVEFRETFKFKAFNEEKTLKEWLLDERCSLKDRGGIEYRINKYQGVISNEKIISLKDREIHNVIPKFILISPGKMLYKLCNFSNLNKSIKVLPILKGKGFQSREGWSIKRINESFDEWLARRECRMYARKLSIEDLKLMWDEELIKKAKVLDFIDPKEIT